MIDAPALSRGSARARPSAWLRLDVRTLPTIALCLTFIIVLALALAATPRRTGDAHQYIAMALQFAQLRPPSLSAKEESDYRRWLDAQPPDSGFPDGAHAIRQPALVRDGHQEFSHFWLYPLLATPATIVVGALGLHPIVAFAVTNAALLAAALWATRRVFGALAALLLLASPLAWFVNKAQVEIFTVSLLCLALAAAANGRWAWASVAVAVAATQNLPIAATVPFFWMAGIATWARHAWRSTGRPSLDRAPLRSALLLGSAATAIALLHPVYYSWRLGVVTPQQLNGGIAGTVPSLDRYLAVLADPDIGFVPWMPVTATVAIAGLLILSRSALRGQFPAADNGRYGESAPLHEPRSPSPGSTGEGFGVRAPRRQRADPPYPRQTSSLLLDDDRNSADQRLALPALCAAVTAIWFPFVFAQTTNVNSGGTVYVSRYALWLLPLTLPAVAIVTRRLERRWPIECLLTTMILVLLYIGYFRPDQPERYVEHSPQAAWLVDHFPTAYRPLPEIFAERTLHIDGGTRASAADPACRLILLVAASPDQPCPLSSAEREQVSARLARDAAAVWVRRNLHGGSSVSTALTKP